MNTQPFVEQLDIRYGSANARWMMYRASCGTWVVLLTIDDGINETITGATIEDALTCAVNFVALPVIPKRPREMHVDQFEPRKSGGYWHLYYGDDFCGALKSKRDSAKAAQSVAERNKRDVDEWDSKYSDYLTRLEGIDFRYKV